MTRPKPSTRGGKRKGAGRPVGSLRGRNGRSRPILRTSVDPETLRYLRRHKGEAGRIVDRAIALLRGK